MNEGCTEKCWTPVPCPGCGMNMAPSGRSAPMGTECGCSEKYKHTKINTRHLWNRHDSTRAYTDKAGWEAHLAECERCREE